MIFFFLMEIFHDFCYLDPVPDPADHNETDPDLEQQHWWRLHEKMTPGGRAGGG